MKQFLKISPGVARLNVWLPAILTFFSLATVVSAHALLTKSTPEDGAILEQAPKQVTAWFSQELDTRLSTMRISDSQGRQVDNGDGGVDLHDPDHASMLVTLPASLPQGTFVVHWTAVSVEDGDSTEGQFSFGMGQSPVTGQVTLAPAQTHNDDSELPLVWLLASIAVLLFTVSIVYLTSRSNRNTTNGI